MYERHEPLTRQAGETRIFAPVSYRVVREAQVIPVVHVEALAMAPWFPICWEARCPMPVMVVLRSLLGDGRGHPAGSPRQSTSLPLSLRAYPFCVARASGERGDQPTEIDLAVPDQPTDIGAPILTADGRPGRGAQMRLRAAGAFNSALGLTEAMTAHLAAADLLAPWPLNFEVGEQVVSIESLMVVRPDSYNTPAIRGFIRAFGSAGALFLGAHRLSLFRAGVLLESARAAVRVH